MSKGTASTSLVSTQRARGNAFGIPVELGAAVELDAAGMLGPFQLPGVALAQPVIGLLDLAAVLDALAEHAVLVADAVAHHRQLQGGATIEEAGRQPAEAAVAETGVVLVVDQLFQFQAQPAQHRLGSLAQAEIEQRVVERATHQEFQRQVVGVFGALLLVGIAGVLPAFHQAVAQGEHQRLIGIVGRTTIFVAAEKVAEVTADIEGQRLFVHAQRRQLEEFLGGFAGTQRLEAVGVLVLVHGRCRIRAFGGKGEG